MINDCTSPIERHLSRRKQMKQKALIYCSVYAKDVKENFAFQEGALCIINIKLDYEFFWMFIKQSGRGELVSYVMKKLLTHVRRKYIVTIIIWDSTLIISIFL